MVIDCLTPYQPIFHLLKELTPSEMATVSQVYVHTFASVFKRELRDYFHLLRKFVFREQIERGNNEEEFATFLFEIDTFLLSVCFVLLLFQSQTVLKFCS
jgi:hypothetical protein